MSLEHLEHIVQETYMLFNKWDDPNTGLTDLELARLSCNLRTLQDVCGNSLSNRLLNYSAEKEGS